MNKDNLDNNQWQIRCLEEVVDILDGMRKPIKKEDRVTGEIPYYGATGIIDWVKDYIFDEPLILVGEDGENLRSRVLPMAFKIQGKAWVNNHAHVLRPYKNVDIDYLTYYLDSISYEDYITGSAQPKLNQKQLRKVKVLLPHLREQQKVASILSSVDEAIEKTTAIIEQTEEVKKGLMQQLLTKGIGHTKFKKTEIGEIPQSWILVKVEEVCDILNGLRKPIKKADRVLGDIPYYGATGVIDWVNDYIFNEPLVLVGEDGENIRSRVLPMAFKIEGKSWVNNHAHVLRPKASIDIDYLELYLEFIDYEKYITGSAQPKINQQVLRKIKVALPQMEEQKVLSRSINAIASKLQKEREKLLQLQDIKKGLMQSLLTGKVRVKIDEVEVTQV
ncbi:restriction endonuclease subunit S [Bacillus cereus]|uniref:restriction endonuclease subunit S n=1 Tax=Bacillus cereus TaxID=1396 RepID=UPI00163C4C20|nr:restriction endonuclease subunit S [Bacillus cereus]